MSVYELNRQQMECLKQRHAMDKWHDLSWGEIASIDLLVSDQEIYEVYDGVLFVEDDF